VRRVDSLTIAGAAGVLIGAFGLSVADRAPQVFLSGACIIVLSLALLVTAACWSALARFGGEATGALLVSWLGVVPGIGLLVGLTQPADALALLLPISLIDLLWYACGPMMFAVSAVISPPGESPGALNLVRIGHLAAWVGPAALALGAC
jgi:hypothetical protein